MYYEQNGLLPLKSIPYNVKNILIEENALFKQNLYCLPEIISQVVGVS